MRSICKVIRQVELTEPHALPDLRTAPTLLLCSDYSGHHKAAAYEAYSFLLADLVRCSHWNDLRNEVRTRFLRDRRQISFKQLNDRRRRAALIPFLGAADMIPGMLLTVVVAKTLSSGLRMTGDERAQLPAALRAWPTSVIKRLIWVTHIGGLLVAGLSRAGQNLIWFTDQDDIAANSQRVIDVTPMVGGVASIYLTHSLGHLRFGTTACDCGDLLIEDATALPDLAAGAFVELAQRHPFHRAPHVRLPVSLDLTRKSRDILEWYQSGETASLRRAALLVDVSGSGHRVSEITIDMA
jgi:hypothetical protein